LSFGKSICYRILQQIISALYPDYSVKSQVEEAYFKFTDRSSYFRSDLTNHLRVFSTSSMLIVLATSCLAEKNI